MFDTVSSPAVFPFCLVCRISELGMEIQKCCPPTRAVSKLIDSRFFAQYTEDKKPDAFYLSTIKPVKINICGPTFFNTEN